MPMRKRQVVAVQGRYMLLMYMEKWIWWIIGQRDFAFFGNLAISAKQGCFMHR